jgi:amidohydrolase
MDSGIQHIIRTRSAELFDKVKGYREHMHRFPELSYAEYNTMSFVAEQLENIGIPYQKEVAGTGVLALIRSSKHSETDSCIGLRSELDALPILEQNTSAYKSTNEGVMHACGHDVHTAILLGTAEIIWENRELLTHPIKLFFQPGEEKNPGGASLMIADGALQNPPVHELVALHVFPEMEVGNIGFRPGLYMASCDEIYLTIHGKGGHGATPHQTIDPIMIGAQLLTGLQQIVSRKCDPKVPCVLSFGYFEALGATNIIPEKAVLKGTFRTMNEDWRKEALALIEKQVYATCEQFGGRADLEISKGYPYLENDPVLTAKMIARSTDFFGKKSVEELPIRLTSEDFSFYAQEIPVCFFRLGVRNEELGIIYGVHHPKFDIDSKALIVGMQAMCLAAFD